jgi:hypothetical protein
MDIKSLGQDFIGMTLLIPDKEDDERQAVADAWAEKGGEVLRIAKFWNPPLLDNKDIRVYGNNLFCLILAEKLGLELISPEDDLLIRLEEQWTNRKINITTLSDAKYIDFPAFIKPVVPKIFRAGIYRNLRDLETECYQLELETPVYVSEIVDIIAEVRCFIFNGQVMTLSVYEGNGELNEARNFINRFIKCNKSLIPNSLVLDVGLINNRGWSVIEANAAWGAGLNGCDAAKAVWSIANASKRK